jgi:hypothetical protein
MTSPVTRRAVSGGSPRHVAPASLSEPDTTYLDSELIAVARMRRKLSHRCPIYPVSCVVALAALHDHGSLPANNAVNDP